MYITEYSESEYLMQNIPNRNFLILLFYTSKYKPDFVNIWLKLGSPVVKK